MDKAQQRKEFAYARARASGKAIFLYRVQREGWTAKLPVYVIWCDGCETYTESHLAGYGRITCTQCRRHTVRRMTWRRFRDKELRPFIAMSPFFLFVAILGIALIILIRRSLGG